MPNYPQTSRAVSTTSLIFAACVSAAIALPSTVLENPPMNCFIQVEEGSKSWTIQNVEKLSLVAKQ